MKRSKRTGTRGAWYIWYRQLRIIRRETSKQYMDMLIFGTGWIKIGADVPDLIQHAPTEDVIIDAKTQEARTR